MGGNRRETWEATSQASIQWRKSAGDGTPFLVIQAISKKSILRLTSISRLEKATWNIGTGAPPRIAVHPSADVPPFARDARSKQVWVWECSSRPQGCLRASHRVGCNRAGTLVIHENDATWGDFTIRHLERRRDGALGKQPFSTAQRQRIDL